MDVSGVSFGAASEEDGQIQAEPTGVDGVNGGKWEERHSNGSLWQTLTCRTDGGIIRPQLPRRLSYFFPFFLTSRK